MRLDDPQKTAVGTSQGEADCLWRFFGSPTVGETTRLALRVMQGGNSNGGGGNGRSATATATATAAGNDNGNSNSGGASNGALRREYLRARWQTDTVTDAHGEGFDVNTGDEYSIDYYDARDMAGQRDDTTIVTAIVAVVVTRGGQGGCRGWQWQWRAASVLPATRA